MAKDDAGERIRDAVRESYAVAAQQARSRQGSSCCSGSGCCSGRTDLYGAKELEAVPAAAAMASLGCGNPTLLAELRPGEVVLDLGSGGGIDVLLSARRVGPTGRVYGLDMTEEMLELARGNALAAGATNVEFLKGQIESIPLPDASVDVVISNCVINLSADKGAVLSEAHRVLRPGGRFAVADVVVQGPPLPPNVRGALSLWTRCVSGALTEEEYRGMLRSAGFTGIDLEVLGVYDVGDLPPDLGDTLPEDLGLPAETSFVSAFLRARKATPPPLG